MIIRHLSERAWGDSAESLEHWANKLFLCKWQRGEWCRETRQQIVWYRIVDEKKWKTLILYGDRSIQALYHKAINLLLVSAATHQLKPAIKWAYSVISACRGEAL